MLISQKVAIIPSFLKIADNLISKGRLEYLRKRIIEAVKFVVPVELLNDDDYLTQSKTWFGDDYNEEILSGKRNEYFQQYKQFCRLPFPVCVFENDSRLLLCVQWSEDVILGGKSKEFKDHVREVEKLGKPEAHAYLLNDAIPTLQRFVVYTIDRLGNVFPIGSKINNKYSLVFGKNSLGKGIDFVSMKSGDYLKGEEAESLFAADASYVHEYEHSDLPGMVLIKGHQFPVNMNQLLLWAYFDYMGVNELLKYLNCANAPIKVYRPSKKELSRVPKVIQSKFEYRVLNIYKERKEYVNLDEVVQVSMKKPGYRARRASFVRGHVKIRNGKPFWWNPHMRNGRNLEKVGFVDKDYSLVNENH